jgi:hypothetical protein
MPTVEMFTVAISRYTHFEDLDADEQVGRLLDLLARCGARHRPWAARVEQRDTDQVMALLRYWTGGSDGPDAPLNTILSWVGHGRADGYDVALALGSSPARVGRMYGVAPDQLADTIRLRQAIAWVRAARQDDQRWALVLVDAGRAHRFAQLLAAALNADSSASGGVLLVGASGDGDTSLGRFADALRAALTVTYRADGRIPLTDPKSQLKRLPQGSCEVFEWGDLTDDVLPSTPSCPCGHKLSPPIRPGLQMSDHYTAETRLQFIRRLGPDWRDLADLLGIQPYERDRFPQGHEPREILEWLHRRNALGCLREACRALPRPDLVELLDRDQSAALTSPPRTLAIEAGATYRNLVDYSEAGNGDRSYELTSAYAGIPLPALVDPGAPRSLSIDDPADACGQPG